MKLKLMGRTIPGKAAMDLRPAEADGPEELQPEPAPEPEPEPRFDEWGFLLESDEEDEVQQRALPRTPRRRGSISAAKAERQRKRAENWLAGLARAGSAGAVQSDKRHAELQRKICRGGLPDELRGEAWLAVRSQSRIHLMAEAEHSYAALLAEACERVAADNSAEEPHTNSGEDIFGTIEADIGRTFPGHSWLDTADGHAALRNVLQAFAVYMPSVGYCQSMNFIAAMLLVVFRSTERPTAEEDSFWTLAVLETVILPNYHQRDLIGCQADARALFTYTRSLLPKLHAHMEGLGIVPEVAFLPWFLALFVNALPVKSVLRVWDMMLSDGSRVLLSVSLAILKLSVRTETAPPPPPFWGHCLVQETREHLPRQAWNTSIRKKLIEQNDDGVSAGEGTPHG